MEQKVQYKTPEEMSIALGYDEEKRITEWLKETEVFPTSLKMIKRNNNTYDHARITNDEWLKLEQKRLEKKGKKTIIYVFSPADNQEQLKALYHV